MYAHLPNGISYTRMLAGFILWYLIVTHATFAALIVLTLGAWSDFFDGYFARRWHLDSEWGVFLDPLADKIFIITAFAALWHVGYISWLIVVSIALRDIVMTGVRTWFMRRGNRLRTIWIAKCKTVFQLGSLYCFIIGDGLLRGSFGVMPAKYVSFLQGMLSTLGVLVAVITVVTGLVYIPQIMQLRKTS